MTLSPRVLVGCPTNDRKNYCRQAWIDTAKSLSYPFYDVYCCDNSADQQYYALNFLMKGIDCGYVSPQGKINSAYVCESQRNIAKRVIDGGYDFLLFLEIDIKPPLDIIEQMISYEMPLVVCDYFIDAGTNSRLLRMEMEEMNFGKYTNRMILQEESYLEYGTGKTRSRGVPFGCTLIHRDILINFPFFIIEGDAFKSHSDIPMSFALYEAEIKPIYHPIIVEHRNSDWQNITDR